MDIQHIAPRVDLSMSAADEKKGFALENRNHLLFKQKNRWGLTVLSVVICLLLSPMLALSAFLPQIVTLVPVMLMLLLGYVGPVSAAACTAVIVSVSSAIMGVWGGMLSMLLLVPVVIVGAYMVEKDSPFWLSAAGTGVTMFASMGDGHAYHQRIDGYGYCNGTQPDSSAGVCLVRCAGGFDAVHDDPDGAAYRSGRRERRYQFN